MHTNTSKNNKFLFYKMVHDQVVAKQASHLTATRLAEQLRNGKVPF